MTMKKCSYDIVIAGRGGQGVLFLSRIMGEAALRQGLGVRTTETHGMAMRGGSVLCFVRIGDGMGPLFRKRTASLLLALHAGEADLGRVYLRDGAEVLINTPGGHPTPGTLAVDADALALSGGNPGSANLALLGAATAADGFPVSPEIMEQVIMEKGPERLRAVNLEIFRLGKERTSTIPVES